MAELGVTKAGQLDLPFKEHTTTGKAVTGDIVGATTAKEAIEGMRPQFEIQGGKHKQLLKRHNRFDDRS